MRSKTGWMIVVPLSNGAIIPGGILEKGYSVYLKDERGYAPDVPMVTVMPKPGAINLAKRRFMTTIHQTPLSSTSNKLREEIKTLLSLATIIVNGNEGQKEYVSDALKFRIRLLAWDVQLHEDWNWKIIEFTAPKRIPNPIGWTRVIPLHEDTFTSPGGDLMVGCISLIVGEPVMTANTPAIFLTR